MTATTAVTPQQTRPKAGKTRAVVFVDHSRWGIFTQLGAYVRKSGFRAVRVTLQRDNVLLRRIDRLVFHRVIHTTREGMASLGQLLADENVADVQCTEYVCELVAGADLTGLPVEVVASLRTRGALLDKFYVGQLADERGVRAPEKLAATDADPDAVVARLGLPVVLKARVGASGDRVRIAETREELVQALADLGPNLDELFYERFVPGECIDYSAIVGPDGPVQEVVTRAYMNGATTPPSTVEIVDEPELIAFGELAADKLDFTGIVHMDTVKDEAGQYWLLDLNLRAWGSMFACRHAGIDFGEPYLYSIGLHAERPPVAVGRMGGTVRVFPGIVYDSVRSGGPAAGAKAFAANSGIYLRWLGVRYWTAQLLSMVVGYGRAQR